MTKRPSSIQIKNVGRFVIAAVTFVVYHPALTIGFFGDDWFLFDRAGRLSLPEYVRFYTDPEYFNLWFRPLYVVLLRVEYILFGGNSAGYHLIQILLHLGICLLLVSIASQITGRWRIGFFAALLYAVFAIHSLAVYWVTVQDPLAVLFYLAALWFWLRYLSRGKRLDYAMTLLTTVCALLSKEISVTLPLVLLLIDILVVRKKQNWSGLITKYFAFGLILLLYLFVENIFQSHSAFVKGGYGVGFHIFFNLARYGMLLLFSWLGMPSEVPEICTAIIAPWDYVGCYWLFDHTIIYLIAFLALVAFLAALVISKRREILFWGCLVLLTLLPVIPFPEEIWGTRYLYAPAIGVAVLLAWLLDAGWRVWQKHKTILIAFTAGFVLVIFVNSVWIANAKAPLAEKERQRRVPFRDIAQAHPNFPDDTFLYFTGSSDRSFTEFSGMFLAKYGNGVSVGGTSLNVQAGLRNHLNPLIYYFDETGRPSEVKVERDAETNASPKVPERFESGIALEGYEVSASALKRGDALVILLYWRSIARIPKDYTVFVHLVDKDGATLFGEDGEPVQGKLPTSTWKDGELIVDSHLLQLPDDLPTGENYRLSIGLYYLPTSERQIILNAGGKPIADSATICCFRVGD